MCKVRYGSVSDVSRSSPDDSTGVAQMTLEMSNHLCPDSLAQITQSPPATLANLNQETMSLGSLLKGQKTLGLFQGL